MISRHFAAAQLLHPRVVFCNFHRLLALPAMFLFRPPSRCTQCSPKSVARDDSRCGGVREPEPMADRCIGHTRADRYRRRTSNRAARMRQSIREKATIRRQDALVGVRTKGIAIIQRGPPSPSNLVLCQRQHSRYRARFAFHFLASRVCFPLRFLSY